MTCVVIPMKPLHEAKSRLSGALEADERRDMALLMLEKVLGEALACAFPKEVLVVTPDPDVKALAAARGASVVMEKAAAGLNTAVKVGLAAAGERRHGKALIIPADIPFATAADFQEVYDACCAPHGSVIVPCRRLEGTNAMIVPLPTPLQPSYGAGSFRRHLAGMRSLGLNPKVVFRLGVSLDIDEPDDLVQHPELRSSRAGREEGG